MGIWWADVINHYSCIRDDWKGDKTDTTGVDFNEMEDTFREKVCTPPDHVGVE